MCLLSCPKASAELADALAGALTANTPVFAARGDRLSGPATLGASHDKFLAATRSDPVEPFALSLGPLAVPLRAQVITLDACTCGSHPMAARLVRTELSGTVFDGHEDLVLGPVLLGTCRVIGRI